MYVIIVKTARGWTDFFGQHGDENTDENTWESLGQAVHAVTALQVDGIIDPENEVRIVSADQLDQYELVC